MGVNAADQVQAFSPRAMLALVLVGIVSLAGLAVLSAYAPDLRGGRDGGSHALSKSAVGYAGAVIFVREAGMSTYVSRTDEFADPKKTLLILTPNFSVQASDIRRLPEVRRMLIVLPKWRTEPDLRHRGFVRKMGVYSGGDQFAEALKGFSDATVVAQRKGVSQSVLRGVAKPFAQDFAVRPAKIDALQTISGQGWRPVIVDDQGHAVLVQSEKKPWVWVLAEPDLLNNHGLANLETARAAYAILDAVAPKPEPSKTPPPEAADDEDDEAQDDGVAVAFDVTLAGFGRGRGLGRLMLEPPWLGATLIGVATALLMGLHALARFGAPRTRGRALALGSLALVDNSAGLFRLARKEHELAPALVAMVEGQAAAAAGIRGGDRTRLKDLARRRGVTDPDALTAEAATTKSRDDLVGLAGRLNQWKSEILRERR